MLRFRSAWLVVAGTLALVSPGAGAAPDEADLKLIVGYVGSVAPGQFVLVLDRAGYPGQVRGTQVRLVLDRSTRVFEAERPATPAAIEVRRAATVLYADVRGVNVAREVRLHGALPPGVAFPGAETGTGDARTPGPPPAGAPGRGDAWHTAYDAFIAEVQTILQSRGPYNSALAARFQGQRVTWEGDLMAIVTRPGKGHFLEIGFPQRRWRLRDGSSAFIGFAITTAGTRVTLRESKAIAAIHVPFSDGVLPTGKHASIPDLVRVSFVLKRVWIQPIDPRENPKLAGNHTLAVQTDSPRLVTKLDTR